VDDDLHIAQHGDNGLARDAVQEGVGKRRMHLAVLDEEDVGTRLVPDDSLFQGIQTA
jgi:hypothetical protein